MKAIIGGLVSLLAMPVLAMGALGSPQVVTPVQVLDLDSLESNVLSNPNIELTSRSRSDIEAGAVDTRVLTLLVLLAQHHQLGHVGPIKSGHSYFVKGTTRVSNHSHGRAVDIGAIDGRPVTPGNVNARRAVELALSLTEPIRPHESGSPWPLSGTGSFSDPSHLDHLHFGWRSP